jgi:beta-carotene ketolase (CrtW type)
MHHTITRNTKINHFIGWFCALLFAFNDYYRLLPKHHEHHRFVASEKDPDYYNGNFGAWYFSFLLQYLTIRQFILMAITFNLLLLFFPLINLILYWMLPAILSTFQLFYFGTYLPHKNPETLPAPHYARSQRRNHLFAFISCYFFGYHFEHHQWPGTPWWQLYKRKA